MSAISNQNQLKRRNTIAFNNKVKSVTTASWDMTSLGSLESSSISICSPTTNPIKPSKPNKIHNQSNSEVTNHF